MKTYGHPSKIAYLKEAMYASKIESVRMPGHDRDLKWAMGARGVIDCDLSPMIASDN